MHPGQEEGTRERIAARLGVPVVRLLGQRSGVSARMNILGALILEAYYAQPWQRPGRGWHWGFNLAPGW